MSVSDRIPDSIDVFKFFSAVIKQDPEKLRSFFEPDATITWPNTSEIFAVDEYIRATCEYPAEWHGRVEDIQSYSRFHDYNKIFVVVKVWDNEGNAFRAVWYIELGDTDDELIKSLVEYWGDVGEPPEWRQNLEIGKRYGDKNILFF